MSKRLEDNVSPGLLASLDQLAASTGALIRIPLDRSFADVKYSRIPPADLAIILRQLADQLDALVRALTDAGVGARRDRGRLEVQVAADRVPRVLAAVAEQRVTDVTCEAASLEDLFLRHYEDVR